MATDLKPRRFRLAAYALIREADRLLLCRISKHLHQWRGYWTLPGGGVEFGETPEDAMVREVEEETGLHVAPGSVAGIDTVVGHTDTEDFHSVRIIYHGTVLGGVLRNEVNGSTDACEWHALDGADELNLVDLAKAGLRLARQSAEKPS